LIHASLKFLQLEIGTYRNVFSLPYDSWHFLATDCWLKTLWRFLDYANIQLQSKMAHLPLPPCQHDGSIMEDALLANLFCPAILAINCCHIAHQAIYWSDVTNGWGDGISPGIL